MHSLILQTEGKRALIFVALAPSDVLHMLREGGLPNVESTDKVAVEAVCFWYFNDERDPARFIEHITSGGRVKDFQDSDGERLRG